MNSIFPELFYLSFIFILVLRLSVAYVFLYDAQRLWKLGAQNKAFAVGWLVLGLAIGVGIFTQGAVIVAGIHVLYLSLYNKNSVFSNRLLALLASAILVFILISGAGGYAYDNPF